MAELATTTPINVYQLSVEAGGSPSFNIRSDSFDSDGFHQNATISTDDLTQQELEDLVAAHVADPLIQLVEPDPPPTESERLGDIEAAIQALLEV